MENEIYLDNAATSHPKPNGVLSAVQSALTSENANPGRSGHSRALRALGQVLACRETLASAINAADPIQICFTFNCTDALNLAIKGIMPEGGHVIASMLEHNSVLRVLESLKQTRNIRYTLIPPQKNGVLDPARYAAAREKDTCLMIATHASNVTGAVQPVKEIAQVARASGIPFLADGAQAMGHIPVNIAEIGASLYAFAGHKGLLGPQGTGGLYVSSEIRLAPFREGGTGSSSDKLTQPEELPERYEAGTLNLPGIMGLQAGTAYSMEKLPETQNSVNKLVSETVHALSRMSGVTLYHAQAENTGIVSFNLGDFSSAQTAEKLNARNILARGGLHCAPMAHQFLGTLSRGAVRASFGAFNTEQDAQSLIQAVWEILRE